MITYTPVVYFSIGKKQLFTIPPNCIMDFVFEDNLGPDKWNIRIIDPDGVSLEKIIAENFDQIKLKFGYVDGPMSELYEGIILDYVPTFTTDREVEIRIDGRDIGSFEGSSVIKTRVWKDLEISEIVEKICLENDWKPDIEPTRTILDTECTEDGFPDKLIFYQRKIDDLSFISKELAPVARSVDGRVDYRCWFEPNRKLCFKPWELKNAIKRKYVIGSSNSDMIRFSPEVRGRVMIAAGANAFELSTVLPMTGEPIEIVKDNELTTKKVVLGPKTEKLFPPERKAEGKVFAGRSMSLPYRNEEALDNAVESAYINRFNLMFSATAEIIGDPQVQAGDTVSVVVITSSGKTHYTSGNYFVKSAVHQIRPGSYVTILDLVTNALAYGITKAVGIVRKPTWATVM